MRPTDDSVSTAGRVVASSSAIAPISDMAAGVSAGCVVNITNACRFRAHDLVPEHRELLVAGRFLKVFIAAQLIVLHLLLSRAVLPVFATIIPTRAMPFSSMEITPFGLLLRITTDLAMNRH